MNKPKVSYRGWQGHFCAPCRFHLNTLIENEKESIIVSTVGDYHVEVFGTKMQSLGADENSFYETMVFMSASVTFPVEGIMTTFIDADVENELPEYMERYKNEVLAAIGHDKVVASVIKRLTR